MVGRLPAIQVRAKGTLPSLPERTNSAACAELRAAAPLRADLHDAVVPPGRLDHAPAFDEVVRDRLLDVDVLARLAGPDGRQGVPVVGRGDHQGVDIAILQDTAHVLLDARLPLLVAGPTPALRHHVVIRIDNGDDLRPFSNRVNLLKCWRPRIRRPIWATRIFSLGFCDPRRITGGRQRRDRGRGHLA